MKEVNTTGYLMTNKTSWNKGKRRKKINKVHYEVRTMKWEVATVVGFITKQEMKNESDALHSHNIHTVVTFDLQSAA